MQKQQSFIAEQETLYENSKRFFALEDKFEALYDVELESGRYVSFDRDEFYKRNVSDMVVSATEFFDSLRANIDKVVYEEDREAAYNVQTREAIVKALAVKDHVDHYYRIITDSGLMWLKMRIVYKDAQKKNVIIGIFNAEEEMAAKQKEENFKQELIQNNARLFALEDNFESLYDVDLENGYYDVFVKGDYYRNNVLNNLSVPKDYFKELRGNINAVIYAEDRDALYNTLTRESIRRELSENDHFDYFYRIKSANGPVWFKMRIVYKDANRKNVVIGVFNAENNVEAKQIAEQKAKIEESLTFTNFFLDTYVSAYYVNLADLSCKIYKRTGALEKNYPIVDNYLDSLTDYINHDVHPEDRDALLEIARPEKMREILKVKNEFSHIFRDISDDVEKAYRMQVIRCADESHAAFGFIDVSEEVKEQNERLKEAEASKKLIESIAASYNIAYAVNLNDDSFKLIRMDSFIIGADKTFHTFTEAKEFFIGLMPESDRETMRHELDYGTIREKLSQIKSYNVEYRLPVKGAMLWHEMNVTVIDAERIAVGFAVRDIEITLKHLENLRFREYFALYEVDIDSGMAKIVKSSPWYGAHKAGTALPYTKEFLKFAATLDEEPRKFFEQVADLNYVKSMFASEAKHTYAYRSKNVGAHTWVECTGIVTMRHSDGAPAMFILGFSQMDSIGIRRQELQSRLNIESQRVKMLKGILDSSDWIYEIDAGDNVISAHYGGVIENKVGTDCDENPMLWIELVHPEDRERTLAGFMAAITDHSGKTAYDEIFRIMGRDGEYRWSRSVGEVLRRNDGTGEYVGMSMDMTKQMEEQQRRMLGAIPISPDILAMENIGLWSFELDEGQPPRMYGDKAMLKLVGLDRQVPPEEMYHAWYDHIDKDCYQLVHDAVAKMMAGEHAEVQYPWHHPDGHTMIVRCGGVRNPAYTKGIRVEGSHQNVSEVIHYDDAEIKRLRAREIELMHAEFRASAIAYLAEHEGDEKAFLNYFAGRLRELIKCDQVIYQGADGKDIVNSTAELKDFQFDPEVCGRCPHQDYRAPVYADGMTEMPDHTKGFNGVFPPKECPVKSSLTRVVYLDGKPSGYLAIHYLRENHTYTDYERKTLEEVTNLLSLSLSRYAVKKQNVQLSQELELKRQIEKQKDQLEKNMQMIGGLASGYNALYYINIDEDTLNIYALDETKYPGSRAIFEGQKKDFIKIIGGYGLSEQVHPDDRYLFNDFTPEGIRKKLTGRKKFTMRFRAATATGYRWDEMELIKYEDINERANAIAIGFTDRDSEIRREQEYQQQLEETRIAAENANRAKTDFLFSMSHDIRTPMNAITGFTNMATKHIDDREKVLDCLGKIRKSESMLLSLINSVLEVSRIESGNAKVEQQLGNVLYSFSNIEHTMRELAATKDIDLSFEFGEIRDKYVYADFSRCMRIFVNVISNAIKYTHEGGFVKVRCEQIDDKAESSELRVESTEENNSTLNLQPSTACIARYRYTVTDNGIGMSEEFQKHVFEQFAREETSTVSGIQGSGLGMSVVKSFVDLMGGTVECRSKQGVGTTFTIILPFKLQAGEQYTDPVTGNVVSHDVKGTATSGTIDISGKRVLLVDDNELNREIAADILSEEGLLVEEADDGSNAVEMVKAKGANYYDFILMDIQMPVMNGYEATRRIRAWEDDEVKSGTAHGEMGEKAPETRCKNAKMPHIPIIALSANAFSEDKAASLGAGMNDHVAKPINIKELMAVIAKHM